MLCIGPDVALLPSEQDLLPSSVFSGESVTIFFFYYFSLIFRHDHRLEKAKYLITCGERRLKGITLINENLPGSKFETLFSF